MPNSSSLTSSKLKLCLGEAASAQKNCVGEFEGRRSTRMFLMVLLVATVLGAVNAQVPAGANRPAKVPVEFVITPVGYFHPSCVKEIEKGANLLVKEHAIRHADGSLENLSTCAYPHYTASGESVSADSSDEKIPTIGRSWVENEGWGDETKVYSGITAYWPVPAPPNSNDGQTLFYFPGLVDSFQIFQPVLGWNADSNNPQWSISSWSATVLQTGSNSGGNLYPDGNAYHSAYMNVSGGDLIEGVVQANPTACPAGTTICNSWEITTSDINSGISTTISNEASLGASVDQAYAGVLEVYNLVQCGDYPPNGGIEFSNVALYDNNFNTVTPDFWEPQYTTGLSPQCAYYLQQAPIVNNQTPPSTWVALYAGVPETLTVNVSGNGTVTSTNPFGGTPISCPGTCSVTLTQGSYAALSASASSGSTFTGWSGATGSEVSCSGTGACYLYLLGGENITATFTLTSPTISAWPTASAITYGQSLASSTLTGGTASVAGSFNWTAPNLYPGAGSHSEGVTFTPSNTTEYSTVAGSVSVTVNKAALTVTASNAAVSYGAAIPSITPAYSGFVNGDTASSLTTAPSCTTTYTTTSIPGSYPSSCSGAIDANYAISYVAGAVTVNKATPTVSAWPTASAITYGQTLASSTLTGGTASVAGSFSWAAPSTALEPAQPRRV